jgi:hypothetical protein
MPFDSADAYRRFAASVKHDRRFIYERNVENFLDAVFETSASRTAPLKAGSILWRAQLGSEWRTRDKGQPEEMEEEIPFFENRMKPLPSVVKDGRANPRGIAYLYLATTLATAGSELRPWLGASISISQFQTDRELRVVDCTADKKRWPFKGFNADMTGTVPWAPEEYESVVWGDINEAMSIPYNPDESGLNYVPTQIISERLRHGGSDGLAYRSLLAEGGTNIVLFDIKDADPINFTVYEAEKVAYTFGQRDNTWFAKKKLLQGETAAETAREGNISETTQDSDES